MRSVTWQVDNSSHLLEPKTYNNIFIHSNSGHICLTVPLSSMSDSGNDAVFVVKSDGIIEKRKVTTGINDGEYIEILSGLKVGEVVVLDSFEGLFDGVKVEVTMEGEENGRA